MTTIAFDSYTAGNHVDPGSGTLSWNHTCTGANRVLFVVGKDNAGITGITYNGVAMTRLASVSDPTYGVLAVWGLLNPASGTNSIVATISGTAFIDLSSISYTGMTGLTLPDATATQSLLSVSSITTSITTVNANAWVLVATIGQTGFTFSAGSGQTKRGNQSGSDNYMVGDSNGALQPGTHAFTTNTGGTVAGVSMVLVSFAPPSSGSGAFLTNFL
jgi:hypothetical protein